jgi:diguanylate cyclase (GGDEF)-like protein
MWFGSIVDAPSGLFCPAIFKAEAVMAPQFVKNLDIRTRLLLLCFAVAAPLMAMCGLVIWKEYQGLSQVAQRATTFHDELAVRTLDQWIKTHQEELHSLSLLPGIRNAQPVQSTELLQAHASMQPYAHGLALFDKQGKLIASSQKGAKSFDFVHPANLYKDATVSGYTTCPITKQPAILISQPVFTDGKLSGVLVESLKPSAILDLFKNLTEAQGFVVCVVDGDKRVIARTLDNDKWVGRDFSHAKTVTAAARSDKGTIEVVGTCDPIQRTYAFQRVGNTGWLVIVGIPTTAIYGNAADRLLMMAMFMVAAVWVSVGLAYAFTGNFTVPIHELVREAVAIGRGDLSKRVKSDATGGGELGLLARAFNHMAQNLELAREHRFMVEKISESVRQSLDLNHILNTTVLELGTALSASRCCLALVDNDHAAPLCGRALDFNYVWCNPRHGGSPLKNRSVMITEGSILKIILEQGSILSLDVMDDQTFTPMFEAAEGNAQDWKSIKSLIACPIVLNHQPIGMILVHQCDDRRVWLDLELELVEAVARHVALAMDHGNLFARTRRMAEQEFLINQIVRATRASLDTDTILNTVTQELGRALGVEYCQIAQPRSDDPLVITHEYAAAGHDAHMGLSLYGSKLDFQPGSDDPNEMRSVLGIDLAAIHQKITRSNGLTIREAPIAVIADVDNDRRSLKFMEFLGSVGSRSLIAAPLLQEDRVLGILMVHQTSRLRDWQAGEVRLVAALADQLAVAISHAQLFEQVRHQAITDGLTTLYNHIYFKNRLTEELSRAQRKGTQCSLLMIDLDKLKQINDTYGHPIGDAAIRQVAMVLKSLLRSGDTAARYGGEEFGVILPETPLSEAVLIADRLRRNINRNPVPGLGHISASIGAAAYPLQSNNIEELIDKADRALYIAKRGGRNRVCVWDDHAPPASISDDDASGNVVMTSAKIEEESGLNKSSS